MSTGQNSALERRITGDILQLAARRAEARLARRVGSPLRISAGGPAWVGPEELVETWRALDGRLVGVFQDTRGHLEGQLGVVFAAGAGRGLVRRLRRHTDRRGTLDPLERSALREVGSAFLNAAAASLATTSGLEVGTRSPEVLEGAPEDLLPPGEKEALVVQVQVGFRRWQSEAYASWSLDPEVAARLRRRLNATAAPVGSGEAVG